MLETTLPSHNEILQELSNLTDEVFFAFQVQGKKILFLNTAFNKTWDLSHEAIHDDVFTIFNTVHHDDQLLITNAITAIQEDGHRQSLEFRISQSDHTQKWIKVNAYLYHRDETNIDIITGIATDITVEKEYNETVYKFFDKKNALLDIVAHDLSAPLNTIQMSAQVMFAHIKDDTDTGIIQLLEIITEKSRNGIDLIHNLFTKEALELSQEILIKHRVDINKSISGIIKQYQRSMELIKQRFHLDSYAGHVFVNIDPVKFMHVVTNLVTNALKFTLDSGNIWITIENREDTIIIKVRDDGIGIPAEMHTYVFDKYTKAGRPGLKGEPSNGVGLYIIKDIVEQHNGHIWFESERNKGATFFIEIPKE